MSEMDGCVAIITGAARGQGAAEAKLLAANGARVVLTDVLTERGRATAAEIGPSALFVEQDVSSAEGWQEVVYLGMRAVVGPMKQQGGGSIINISSVAGLQGANSLFAYAATKWAVRGMSI